MSVVHMLPNHVVQNKHQLSVKTVLCCLGLVGVLPIGFAASSAYVIKERGYYVIDCHRQDQCLLSITSPMQIRELVYVP